MLAAVNGHIVELEQQFFEEEDSETERELIQNLENSAVTPEEHDRNLMAFKETQHIQQFWTIPLSDSVTELAWD